MDSSVVLAPACSLYGTQVRIPVWQMENLLKNISIMAHRIAEDQTYAKILGILPWNIPRGDYGPVTL